MANAVTVKQEAFATAYVETGGNASEAYRRSYDVSAHAVPNTIEKRACELLKDRKVTGRIEAIRADLRQRHDITLDNLTDMLLAARDKAMAEPKGASAAVAAIVALAKIHGLWTDKTETQITANVTMTDAIDRPPKETREEWLARRQRQIGLQHVAGNA